MVVRVEHSPNLPKTTVLVLLYLRDREDGDVLQDGRTQYRLLNHEKFRRDPEFFRYS
jgi:hypothetical protein